MEQYKINPKSEKESIEAQELMFNLGYKWKDGAKAKEGIEFIYMENNGSKRLSFSGTTQTFNISKNIELTIEQLRQMVAEKQTQKLKDNGYFAEVNLDIKLPNDLLTQQQAKLAWANGHTIEYFYDQWVEITQEFDLGVFSRFDKFRLKPRTITLNGIEITRPKQVDIDSKEVVVIFDSIDESEQFVAALRSILCQSK